MMEQEALRKTATKLASVLVGACFGAITLSGVVKMVSPLLDPNWLPSDGQSSMTFILSLPIGMILGGAGGYELISAKTQTPSRNALAGAGGLCTIIGIVLGLLSADSRGLSLTGFLLTIASPWCLVPLIASLSMLVIGLSSAKGA